MKHISVLGFTSKYPEHKILPHESEVAAKGRCMEADEQAAALQLRKKSARANFVDLQEADHGHSACRSLRRANRGCRNEGILVSEIFPIDDCEVFEFLEFAGTPQPDKNDRNGESGRL